MIEFSYYKKKYLKYSKKYKIIKKLIGGVSNSILPDCPTEVKTIFETDDPNPNQAIGPIRKKMVLILHPDRLTNVDNHKIIKEYTELFKALFPCKDINCYRRTCKMDELPQPPTQQPPPPLQPPPQQPPPQPPPQPPQPQSQSQSWSPPQPPWSPPPQSQSQSWSPPQQSRYGRETPNLEKDYYPQYQGPRNLHGLTEEDLILRMETLIKNWYPYFENAGSSLIENADKIWQAITSFKFVEDTKKNLDIFKQLIMKNISNTFKKKYKKYKLKYLIFKKSLISNNNK
jgi:hypothetical protein